MIPPLARMTCPLIQPPSGPARKATTAATSRASPSRSSGGSFARWSTTAWGLPFKNSSVANTRSAVYVAVTKYQTMDKVSEAQERLQIVRAVGDIPRYLNSERGFTTNMLFGPPAIDPKLRAELNDRYRKNTNGARDKMNAIRADLPGSLADGAELGAGVDGINAKFTDNFKMLSWMLR